MNSLVVTKALLSKGANVNAKVGTGDNIYGETALHYVIKDLSQKGEKQRLIFAQSLLKYGADPSLRSRVSTPLSAERHWIPGNTLVWKGVGVWLYAKE